MQQINFPADYQQVMPYLILKNSAGFLQFMTDVFDAKRSRCTNAKMDPSCMAR
jgi:hypothetical protein